MASIPRAEGMPQSGILVNVTDSESLDGPHDTVLAREQCRREAGQTFRTSALWALMAFPAWTMALWPIPRADWRTKSLASARNAGQRLQATERTNDSSLSGAVIGERHSRCSRAAEESSKMRGVFTNPMASKRLSECCHPLNMELSPVTSPYRWSSKEPPRCCH
jgi:hypothetical protein